MRCRTRDVAASGDRWGRAAAARTRRDRSALNDWHLPLNRWYAVQATRLGLACLLANPFTGSSLRLRTIGCRRGRVREVQLAADRGRTPPESAGPSVRSAEEGSLHVQMSGEPAEIRTLNLGIKSPPLYR